MKDAAEDQLAPRLRQYTLDSFEPSNGVTSLNGERLSEAVGIEAIYHNFFYFLEQVTTSRPHWAEKQVFGNGHRVTRQGANESVDLPSGIENPSFTE